MRNGDHLSERLWAYDDYADIDDRPAETATGLTSLGFIRAALRRSVWLWRILAVVGLVGGFAFAATLRPVYQASTTLLLTPIATGGEAAGAPITNEQAMAHSPTVAAMALSKLGLSENVNSFLASYTATAVSDRLVVITVNAPSSSDAVSRANAVTSAFLHFRVNLLDSEQKLMTNSLNQQITQAKQHLSAVNARISSVSAQPDSSSRRSTLSNLTKQQDEAISALTTLEQTTNASNAETDITNATILQTSSVLDAASPVTPHSRLKRAAEYAALGLVAGLAVGFGFIVIRALMSDRLRRRDDVAYALGAPVKLSVGATRQNRRGTGRRGAGPEALKNPSVRRIASYLDSAVPPAPRRPASLAVVPVDEVRVPAASLVSLALSCAERGLKVVVADLCADAPAARLLGDATPGIKTAGTSGAHLTVVVPDPDDVMPAGPLRHTGPGRTALPGPLTAACESADLLLTLAPLDPSLGGDHLAGWTRGAVVVVTAGRSSAVRIKAVGEMVRLAGLSLISGVLVGADKTDESLGVAPAPDDGRPVAPDDGLPATVREPFVRVDGSPGGRSPAGPLSGSAEDR